MCWVQWCGYNKWSKIAEDIEYAGGKIESWGFPQSAHPFCFIVYNQNNQKIGSGRRLKDLINAYNFITK